MKKIKGTHMADWAANDYTFKMGLTFYFQELSQNFPLESGSTWEDNRSPEQTANFLYSSTSHWINSP